MQNKLSLYDILTEAMWGHVCVERSGWVTSWLGLGLQNHHSGDSALGQEPSHLQEPEYQHGVGLFFSIFSPGVTSLGLDLCILGTLGVYSQMNYRFFLITRMPSDDLGVHCLMKPNSPDFSIQHKPRLALWLWISLLNITKHYAFLSLGFINQIVFHLTMKTSLLRWCSEQKKE